MLRKRHGRDRKRTITRRRGKAPQTGGRGGGGGKCGNAVSNKKKAADGKSPVPFGEGGRNGSGVSSRGLRPPRSHGVLIWNLPGGSAGLVKGVTWGSRKKSRGGVFLLGCEQRKFVICEKKEHADKLDKRHLQSRKERGGIKVKRGKRERDSGGVY